jgi:response regulator RpfG family c-di-GMP phosphodiesterase
MKRADIRPVYRDFFEFLLYLLRELTDVWNYVFSVATGALISVLSGRLTLTPFLVILAAQACLQACRHFRDRDVNTLIQLPAERDDPAFIMNRQGRILLSAGKTRDFFKAHRITHLDQFVGSAGLAAILKNVQTVCDAPAGGGVEVYAPAPRKWYDAQAKPAAFLCGAQPDRFLVWFRDVTVRKAHDTRQQDLLHYSSWLAPRIRDFARRKSLDDAVASFILGTYGAVLIARKDAGGRLQGRVFKQIAAGLEKSPVLTFRSDATAALLFSQRQAQLAPGPAPAQSSAQQFPTQYPFDQRVLDFISAPVQNFISHHEGEVALIAFNCRGTITAYEKVFLETLLNLSRSLEALIALARENDQQFIQKVMGLCAAAEYSDKITGRHILRVNAFSRLIAKKMGRDPDFCDTIGQVAALHDIGKVAIPELIKLARVYTPAERLKMQMHTVYGARIIETMMRFGSRRDNRLVMARNIALHHHQTFNGRGYPALRPTDRQRDNLEGDDQFYLDCGECRPLTGRDIPVEGLIVGLADRYDALRSQRQYKPSFTHAQTLSLMTTGGELGISGRDWYGETIWSAFERGHADLEREYAEMADAEAPDPKSGRNANNQKQPDGLWQDPPSGERRGRATLLANIRGPQDHR